MTTTETEIEPGADSGLDDDAEEPAASTGMPGVDALYGDILARWKAANDRANAADRERRKLRKHVDLIPIGVYDGWQRSEGTAARIVDMDKVKELLAQHGEEVPMKDGNRPLVVVQLTGA